MIQVKICGLMNEYDVDACVMAGVNIIGFVVEYPLPVPWNLSACAVKGLIKYVSPPVKSCVVTGGTVNKVLALAEELRPYIIQLHYKETLDDVRRIAMALNGSGIRTIKALRVDADGNCDFEITDPVLAARELSTTGIDAIVVDSYTTAMPGGTGIIVDLSVFRAVQKESSVPVILAGGLNPENIGSIVVAAGPYGVDVLTGVESVPGQKDKEKIFRLMRVLSGLA